MIEKWKKAIDEKLKVGAIFMDLSKAFDSLNHELLLCKLESYGLSPNAVKLMRSYLEKRCQRTKIGNSFSTWSDIIAGVPQGSILGPLLFNIFLNDIFLFLKKSSISNYADDNTLFAIDTTIAKVKEKLLHDFEILTKWFHENFMALNAGKCHYMCMGNDVENDDFIFNGMKLENSNKEVILGITIDKKLTFNEHVKEVCQKAAQKLGALNRISFYLTLDMKKLIFNAVIKSQFSYCSILYLFTSRTSNNRINKIHERSLRLTYDDFESNFEELLLKGNEISFHHRTIQVLMTEIYKIVNNICPPIMKTLYNFRQNNYNIRNFQEIENKKVRTVQYGLETVLYRGPQLWSLLPLDIKSSDNINIFKSKIKKWVCKECPCRLCQTFVNGLGFVKLAS